MSTDRDPRFLLFLIQAINYDFSPGASTLEIVERGRERVHPHAVALERNADRGDAEPVQPVDRALVEVFSNMV